MTAKRSYNKLLLLNSTRAYTYVTLNVLYMCFVNTQNFMPLINSFYLHLGSYGVILMTRPGKTSLGSWMCGFSSTMKGSPHLSLIVCSFSPSPTIYIDRLVSFQKDSRPNLSHSNSNIQHSNTWSTPLKLIYIISSIYKQKIKCFEYFLPCLLYTSDAADDYSV